MDAELLSLRIIGSEVGHSPDRYGMKNSAAPAGFPARLAACRWGHPIAGERRNRRSGADSGSFRSIHPAAEPRS
jgi:hypothetical protein